LCIKNQSFIENPESSQHYPALKYRWLTGDVVKVFLNNSDFEQELTLDEKAVARGRSFQLSYGFHRDITIYSLFVNLVTLFSLHPVY